MEILVSYVNMDLQLAAYKAQKRGYHDPRPLDGNPIALKMPVVETAARTRVFSSMAKKLRHSAWRRQESYNKQLALFLNRERFQQNQTWQGEYERLTSTTTAPGLQPFVNARLEQLKTLLVQ